MSRASASIRSFSHSLRICSSGAATRTYIPDFIAIDMAGVHWVIEGKADSETSAVTVLARRDAAAAWIDAVKSSGQ